MEKEKENKPLNIRERIVIVLVIFIIRLIKPWQFDHQFDQFWNEIKKACNGEDFTVLEKK